VTLQEFAARLAARAHLEPAALRLSDRLVGDLGVDSLSLMELVLDLEAAGARPDLVDALEREDLEGLTGARLFELATQGSPVGPSRMGMPAQPGAPS
jgi:hypothetical protein